MLFGSYAKKGRLAKVPTLDNKGYIVTGRFAKFQTLSPNSLLTVYGSSHKIHWLPAVIEQISRSDLELLLLTFIGKHDLRSIPAGSKLSVIVVNFLVTGNKSKLHKRWS